MNEFPNSNGLSQLLISIADRLEGNAIGLNKELLIQTAAKMDALERVAEIANGMIKGIPRTTKDKKKSMKALVTRDHVIELSAALREAGFDTKNYV